MDNNSEKRANRYKSYDWGNRFMIVHPIHLTKDFANDCYFECAIFQFEDITIL